jgi:YHS domain-containing protein
MEITKNDSLKVLYNEKDYFFCSNKDMLAFLKQPQKYTGDNMQNHSEHKMEEHNMDHGMMGMSMPLMIIMGGVMIAAMVVGMSGIMR